jgi:hypothetical protein
MTTKIINMLGNTEVEKDYQNTVKQNAQRLLDKTIMDIAKEDKACPWYGVRRDS